MQKFTRALTREIEVAGERLVVTLDGQGLSLRPIGSRQPPLTLTWADVVCSQPQASQDQVASALTALRGVSNSRNSATPELTTLLERLDRWLRNNRPGFHEVLAPPVTEQQLHELQQGLGQPLPEALRQLLRWHNGQRSDDIVGCFYESFLLLGSAAILAEYQQRKTEAEADYDPAWIPLMDDMQGDLLVLDPKTPGCPVREIWRGRKDHAVVADSLPAWFESFVRDVEAGLFSEDPERGEFHRRTITPL